MKKKNTNTNTHIKHFMAGPEARRTVCSNKFN